MPALARRAASRRIECWVAFKHDANHIVGCQLVELIEFLDTRDLGGFMECNRSHRGFGFCFYGGFELSF